MVKIPALPRLIFTQVPALPGLVFVHVPFFNRPASVLRIRAILCPSVNGAQPVAPLPIHASHVGQLAVVEPALVAPLLSIQRDARLRQRITPILSTPSKPA